MKSLIINLEESNIEKIQKAKNIYKISFAQIVLDRLMSQRPTMSDTQIVELIGHIDNPVTKEENVRKDSKEETDAEKESDSDNQENTEEGKENKFNNGDGEKDVNTD